MEFGLNCLVITQQTFKVPTQKSFLFMLKSAMITEQKVVRKDIVQTSDQKSKKYDSPMAKFNRYK